MIEIGDPERLMNAPSTINYHLTLTTVYETEQNQIGQDRSEQDSIEY